MPYKDPAQRKAYHKKYNKERRGRVSKNDVQPITVQPGEVMSFNEMVLQLQDLMALLERTMNDVEQYGEDRPGLVSKARCLFKGVEVKLKVIEITGIERELSNLRNRIKEIELEPRRKRQRGDVYEQTYKSFIDYT